MAHGYIGQGLGGYLMEAAQTFGDNFIGLFDRMGELGAVGLNAAAGALGLGQGAAAVAASGMATEVAGEGVAAATAAMLSPSLADAAMAQGMVSAAPQPIVLPANAIKGLEDIKGNMLALEWSNASAGDVLGNLSKPLTPAVDMPEIGAGMAMA